MERITIPGYHYYDDEFMDSGVAKFFNRLSAYEDTGLEPEDARRLQQDWTSLIMTLDEMGGMPHLRELVQAEKAWKGGEV